MDRTHLELKIPPVLVTIGFALLIWLVSLWLPGMTIPQNVRLAMLVILLGLSALISISGLVSFRLARTTVNPIRPGASSSLVTTGIYRMTRNPMYLGLLLLLVALVVFLSNPYGLALCAVYVLYMNWFQIGPEEEALQSSFGEDYSSYRARVRRWL